MRVTTTELCRMSATELAEAIRSRQASSQQVSRHTSGASKR
jgi:hypothetical protein